MVSCRHARLSSTGRWVSTDGEVAGVGLEFFVLAQDGRSRLPGILTGGRERRGAAAHVRHGRRPNPRLMERSGRWPPRFVVASHGLSTGLLPISAAPVRAPCERTTVERCRIAFDEYTDFGSTRPLLSVGVRRRVLSGWVCKPEVTGSIPVRSTPTTRADSPENARKSGELAAWPFGPVPDRSRPFKTLLAGSGTGCQGLRRVGAVSPERGSCRSRRRARTIRRMPEYQSSRLNADAEALPTWEVRRRGLQFGGDGIGR
jgi:hypothetical protein